MACFTVTVAEAIVATIVTKVVESKEKKAAAETAEQMKYDPEKFEAVSTDHKIPFSRKLKWLDYMLWGGSALLAFEHIWHGELVPWFPFLSNAANSKDAVEMVHEIGTTGVVMAVLLTVIWIGIVVAASMLEKKAAKDPEEALEK